MKSIRVKSQGLTVFLLMTVVLFCYSCATIETQGKPAVVREIRPGLLAGYLSFQSLPRAKSLLPPPPAEGSVAFASDEEIYLKTRAYKGTPRWRLAQEDADLGFPNVAATFSCVLKAPITEKDTPHLYMLLRRTLTDAVLSTYSAKNYYKRTRPFVANKEASCNPNDEKRLRSDGSYPSGHTAIGWAWALILTEIDPENTDAILARGRAFGESRVICGVHWQSDVNEGRFMGASTVARLHADPTFQADLAAAKSELAAARAKGQKPTRDCEEEAKVLSFKIPNTP